MIKSKVINNFITLIMVVSLTASVLVRISEICQMKQPIYTYGPFVESKEDTDVLFLGSSRMINSVFPMLLWKDYGITSYNLGAHANLIPATYWEMENAFAVKQPKLIVLDTYGISNNFKYETPEYLHSWMDAFPLSMVKVKAAFDLTNDPYKDEAISQGLIGSDINGSPVEFLWSFIKYHSRWDEINDEDFNTPSTTEKGAEARIRVESFADKYEYDAKSDEYQLKESVDKDSRIDAAYVGEEYLRKIINSCQEKGIDVILTYLPSESNENHYAQINKSMEIAREYDVDFVNLFDIGIIDPATDYYDAKHVNPLGAKKITSYIGQYISDNYGLTDKRSDEKTASSWDNDYRDYAYYMSEKFAGAEEVANALVQIGFEEFDSVIEVYNQEYFNDETIIDLLGKLSVDTELAGELCLNAGACVIVTHRGGQEAEVYSMNDIPQEYLQLLDDKKQEYGLETEFFVPGCGIRMTVINRISGALMVNEL